MKDKSYIDVLKDKTFKILPLFEEKNNGLPQYIGSLIYELYGLQYLVNESDKSKIVSVMCILEHFYDDSLQADFDISEIKREVFHCLDLIEKIELVMNRGLSR